jgi:hypothetical protein
MARFFVKTRNLNVVQITLSDQSIRRVILVIGYLSLVIYFRSNVPHFVLSPTEGFISGLAIMVEGLVDFRKQPILLIVTRMSNFLTQNSTVCCMHRKVCL